MIGPLILRGKIISFDTILPWCTGALGSFFGLIMWLDSLYNNYQRGEFGWFCFKLLITIVLLFAGWFIMKKLIGEPNKDEFNEFAPLEDGPVGREEQRRLIINFIEKRDQNENLLILTGKSGCGKTSFVKSALISDLKKNTDNIIITIEQYEKYRETIHSKLRECTPNLNIDEKESLREYIPSVGSKKLIYIFDQFEQIFISDPCVKSALINDIREMIISENNVKIIIVVRSESFKDTVMSFNDNNKICNDTKCCGNSVQLIDLPLLSKEEAINFMKWYLPDELFPSYKEKNEVCAAAIRDLVKSGSGEQTILPVSLHIVCSMIVREKITYEDKYSNEGGVTGLERKFIHLVLKSLKNKKIVHHIIFSLCEPSIGSVTLMSEEIVAISQLPQNVVESALADMEDRKLIRKPTDDHYRIIHEYIGELMQDQIEKNISPIELHELKIRRKIKFLHNLGFLSKVRVVKQVPSKKDRMLGVWVFLLSVVILSSRFFISSHDVANWIDLNFLPSFLIGIVGSLMCTFYYINLLSRTAEYESIYGKTWTFFMSVVILPASAFLFWRYEYWPFMAGILVLFGSIKDWQLSVWCKPSDGIKATFRYWSLTMVAFSLLLIFIGFIFQELRGKHAMSVTPYNFFIIEIFITLILSIYIFISTVRFYSLSGLRPIISRINIEVLPFEKIEH